MTSRLLAEDERRELWAAVRLLVLTAIVGAAVASVAAALVF